MLGFSVGFQNALLVTDDPNGTIGITIAGYNGDNQGVIEHYELPRSNGALAVGSTSWPMFHHDPSLSGTTGVLPETGTLVPRPSSLEPHCRGGSGAVSLSWTEPFGAGQPVSGYTIYEATVPGHEAGAPINGSTPVTGTSETVTGLTGGQAYYFEATAITASGEGAPSPEASATPTAAPSTSTAPPGGGGGGAPPVSDAPTTTTTTSTSTTATITRAAPTPRRELRFERPGNTERRSAAGSGLSPGHRRRSGDRRGKQRSYRAAKERSPAVGIAATPDGKGYWLAAGNGKVFAFGDARRYGSSAASSPHAVVVGIAA